MLRSDKIEKFDPYSSQTSLKFELHPGECNKQHLSVHCDRTIIRLFLMLQPKKRALEVCLLPSKISSRSEILISKCMRSFPLQYFGSAIWPTKKTGYCYSLKRVCESKTHMGSTPVSYFDTIVSQECALTLSILASKSPF